MSETTIREPLTRGNFSILIADDDDVGRRAVTRLLGREAYDCIEAGSGQEAQGLLAARKIDLVITDIRMPGNTELELLHHLEGLRPRIPVIVITGHPTVETAMAATSFAASAYLTKPIDPKKLIDVVHKEFKLRLTLQALKLSRQRQEAVLAQMQDLEHAIDLSSRSTAFELAASYTTLTFDNTISTLRTLKETLHSLLEENKEKLNECLNQNRPTELIGAIQEAIRVIEQTKHSFKSKELAALKQKLEEVLKQ